MRFSNFALPATLLLIAAAATSVLSQQSSAPHLEKRGAAVQLIVDDKPYLMLASELHNSSSSSLDYMKPIWPRLAAIPLNTVLTPLSWELIEPIEGKFDFTLVDGLLAQAREQHLHVVFLWLAAWKNGESSYPPLWVKTNSKRFPRVVENGNPVGTLSTLSEETLRADENALTAVMRHLREVDARDHTVLMMQIENEVGILKDTRDHSPAANQAFASAVPQELTRYLQAHRETLNPELFALWHDNGEKISGTWTEIFGDSSRADEIFMAWHYARFVQAETAKAKAVYDLPMYVNTWLAAEDANPGDYPSGGPQPRVIDVWRAAGSALDFFAPDLYLPDFVSWCTRYHRNGNTLFLPETNGDASGAANVFYAVGEHAAIGFSPFGIDSWTDKDNELGASYAVLAQLAPLLLEAQSKGATHGFVLDKSHPSVEFEMNGYTVRVSLDEIFGFHSERGYGLILADGPNRFVGAGRGFRVTFTARSPGLPHAGIASVDEGEFVHGEWKAGRRLNGDENDQGNYWRFDPRQTRIEKVQVYRFE